MTANEIDPTGSAAGQFFRAQRPDAACSSTGRTPRQKQSFDARQPGPCSVRSPHEALASLRSRLRPKRQCRPTYSSERSTTSTPTSASHPAAALQMQKAWSHVAPSPRPREARSISRAGHLSGSPVDVVARFSNFPGGRGPHPDAAPESNPRGLAVQFRLPDGLDDRSPAHSINGFPGRTVDDFADFLQAISPNGPGPGAYLADHDAAREFRPRDRDLRARQPATPPSPTSPSTHSCSTTHSATRSRRPLQHGPRRLESSCSTPPRSSKPDRTISQTSWRCV